MIDQDRTDGTDADLEALLRATFSSEARNQVSDSRPVPPFPATERVATVHPLRRRWVGLSVVAASLVAVAVAATVIGTEAMNADRTPTPAGTSVVPALTVSVPTPSVSTAPTTPAPATTAASTPPAPTTKQVTVQGVVLTVPVAWNVVEDGTGLQTGFGDFTCLSTDTTRTADGDFADNCELEMLVSKPENGVDVDIPYAFGEAALCGSAPQVPQQTVTADQLTVDGQVAEHRVFTAPCVPGTIEQWTVATTPMVLFLRQRAEADPTGEAQAVAAIRSGRLPGPRSPLRRSDRGFVTGASGSTLQLDRVVQRFGAPALNSNPTTYAYPLASSVEISYQGSASDFATLTQDQLRVLAGGGSVPGIPPLDTLTARLFTDGQQVTIVALTPRS